MSEPTLDPHVVIDGRTDVSIIYRETVEPFRRWIIYGKCNCCGLCEVGVSEEEVVSRKLIWTAPAGTPYACVEGEWTPERLDSPVRPEIRQKLPGCALQGEYL